MIEYQKQLELQSHLDGELPEAQAREMAEWLARDLEAAALLTELRQTHAAMAGFEEGIRLPESREFYWSKIQRQIEREQEPISAPAREMSWLVRLRRFLMPVTGLAVAALLLLVVTRENNSGPADTTTETALEDSGAFTYHDASAGVTLVWLSYPADEIVDNDDSLD
jgi:anti-sigma factor RsiW